MITGSTRVAGVIGDPVRHSLSPVLHNAAYRELGLDWVYAAFAVPDGATRAALDAMRALGLAGLSVTMPHKTAAVDGCDELSPAAAALHSVNSIHPDDRGRLVGDSTDGEGFLRALDDAGHDPAGATVLVLGGGGAARAVARALGQRGADVVVCARKSEAAGAAAALGAGKPAPWEDRAEVAAGAAFVVNATPIGMLEKGGSAELPIPGDALRAGQVCVDLVYSPRDTALLQAARGRGLAVVDGLGMLVHQAGLQIEGWTGAVAPIAAMRAAAEAALAPGPGA